MDLVELRLLAVGGLVALGVVMSLLGAAAAGTVERIRRASDTPAERVSSVPALGRRPNLGAEKARC
jgi:hypothetical protein